MSNQKCVEWLLRVGVAGEFVGHGLLAIGKKPDWINWVRLMTHLDASSATTLMVVVGCFDLIVAAIILLKPVKPILLWAAFWGFWTALVRPIVMYLGATGVGWLDFVERSANWAAPLALYYFYKVNKK